MLRLELFTVNCHNEESGLKVEVLDASQSVLIISKDCESEVSPCSQLMKR